MEHGPGASRHAGLAPLEHLERRDSGAHQVAELVDQEADPLAAAVGIRRPLERRLAQAFPAVHRHGTGDRLVQAAIQRAEIVGADG
jgi:hypothetical protein